ncbi:MAG: AzlD domain-containing protein [Pseudomonadota bacterium]
MSLQDPWVFWPVILALGLSTFLIRFSFIGVLGDRELPIWALRLLRYVPVAVLPALVAPMVVWPGSTGGQTDVAHLAAGAAALLVGALRRRLLEAVAAGMGTLYALEHLAGL